MFSNTPKSADEQSVELTDEQLKTLIKSLLKEHTSVLNDYASLDLSEDEVFRTLMEQTYKEDSR